MLKLAIAIPVYCYISIVKITVRTRQFTCIAITIVLNVSDHIYKQKNIFWILMNQTYIKTQKEWAYIKPISKLKKNGLTSNPYQSKNGNYNLWFWFNSTRMGSHQTHINRENLEYSQWFWFNSKGMGLHQTHINRKMETTIFDFGLTQRLWVHIKPISIGKS